MAGNVSLRAVRRDDVTTREPQKRDLDCLPIVAAAYDAKYANVRDVGKASIGHASGDGAIKADLKHQRSFRRPCR